MRGFSSSSWDAFDLVVGNPPYGKIGELDGGLRGIYRASLFGHPNAYGLFLHAGLEMLRPGGVLGYIIPRSMLSGLYFKNLRHFVEQRAVLREITLLAERQGIFERVLQGTMVPVVQRQPAPLRSLKTAIVHSVTDLGAELCSPRVHQRQVVRHLKGISVWFVAGSERAYDLLDRILSHSLLSSPAVGCRARTGSVVWNRVKPLLCSRPETDTLPLVWATDVGRFAFSFGSAGERRPSYLKVRAHTREWVTRGLSLLIQRTSADEHPRRLVGCIPERFCAEHEAGYFVENHLNVIQPCPDAPPIDLYYLLGVLSSDVVEFFFRAMNGNTQVSAAELNRLPIPRGHREAEIAALARQLQQTADRVRRTSLEQLLNEEVAALYGLTTDELMGIRDWLAEWQGEMLS